MLKSIEIDLKAIKANGLAIKRIIGPKTKLLAVVKSDGYGHGLIETTKALNSTADYFGVDNSDEALKIRSIAQKPILIFGAVEKEKFKEIAQYNIRVSAYSKESLEELLSQKNQLKIHLKVDTGMHRLGVEPDQAIESARKIIKAKHLELEGLWSHFAISREEKGREYSLNQINEFNKVREELAKENIRPKLCHLANSAGILNYPQALFDLVRSGIMLYGYYPSSEIKEKFKKRLALKPALTFKTKLIQIRRLKRGERIGYGLTYRLPKDSFVGVLPIGYKDGYGRDLSNKGEVLVKGQPCSIIGRICMRMMMVDLGKVEKPKVGEEVVLIGNQGDDKIGAEELAAQIETIPYEILSRLDPAIKRIYG